MHILMWRHLKEQHELNNKLSERLLRYEVMNSSQVIRILLGIFKKIEIAILAQNKFLLKITF